MNNSFEDVISDLVIECHVRAGQPVRIWLRGSLAVEVSIRREWTKLTLFRDGYAPSEDELRRVIDAWPGRIRMMVAPKTYQRDNIFYVETTWPTEAANGKAS